VTNLGEKTLQRKVWTLRGDAMVVKLTPSGIVLKEPRRRRGFLLPYETAFMVAVHAAVDAERRAKPKARKRRASRGLLTT
jgi:hypothetical protein